MPPLVPVLQRLRRKREVEVGEDHEGRDAVMLEVQVQVPLVVAEGIITYTACHCKAIGRLKRILFKFTEIT